MASTKAFYSQIAAGFLLAWAIAEEVGGTVDPTLVAAPPRAPVGHGGHHRPAGRHRRRGPAAGARPSATGPSSATARTASRPRSCASSSASSATGPSPATPRRTRSTSTSRASRSSSCAPPASRAPPPTTWPRRWRSTGPTRPRRSWWPSDGQARFAAALHVISVPETHPQLAFVLTAVAGHLFGYEAALAIDAQARPLREARAAIEDAVGEHAPADGDQLLRSLQPALASSATRFFDGLRSGCLRRQPRGEHGRAARVVVPLRARHRTARRLPGRARPHRHAGGRRRRPHRGADRRGSRSSPARSTRSSTRPRPSPSASRAATRPCCSRRSCRRCWRRAPRATGSATRRCAPWPTSIPRWPRSPAGSATSSTATPEGGEVSVSIVDRGGIALDIPSRSRALRAPAGHQAHRRPRAAGVRHPRS